jgi:hypothetical protein
MSRTGVRRSALADNQGRSGTPQEQALRDVLVPEARLFTARPDHEQVVGPDLVLVEHLLDDEAVALAQVGLASSCPERGARRLELCFARRLLGPRADPERHRDLRPDVQETGAGAGVTLPVERGVDDGRAGVPARERGEDALDPGRRAPRTTVATREPLSMRAIAPRPAGGTSTRS